MVCALSLEKTVCNTTVMDLVNTAFMDGEPLEGIVTQLFPLKMDTLIWNMDVEKITE